MEKTGKIVIFSNGILKSQFIGYIQKGDLIIGVDRAAYWLVQKGVRVDVAIGDFDSTTPEELNIIKRKVNEVIEYPPEKDEIDTELALKYAVKLKPKIIDIYGGFGSRMDQTLASTLLLELYSSHNIIMRLIDEKNIIQLVKNKLIIKKDPLLPYLSIISLTDTSTVSIGGCKYDIPKTKLWRGQTLGISNEIMAKQAFITVKKGKILLVRSRD